MYAPIQVATLAISLLHPMPSVAGQQLHSQPVTISGIVCASPRDMAGLFRINMTQKVKGADDLLMRGTAAGFTCQMLKNASVENWGQVAGADGIVEVSGKTAPIIEVVEHQSAGDRRFYLVAKTH